MSIIRVDTDILISAVEVRPCLWDRFHEDYKDKNKTVEGWKEVCSLLKEGFNFLNDQEKKSFRKEVIKRWNNIRDSFRKYTKHIQKEKKSGNGTSTTKKYVYSEQLRFLEKVFESRPSRTEEVLTSTPPDRLQDEDSANEFQNLVPPSTPKVPRKKKRTDEIDQRMLMALEDNENPHMSFCKGFLPMIQDFNEEETIDFQMGVLNLIRDIKQKRTYPTLSSFSNQRNMPFQHNQHPYPGTLPRFFHSSPVQYAQSQSQSSGQHRKYLQPKTSLKSLAAVSAMYHNRSQYLSSPSSSSVTSSTDSHTRELDET